MDKKWYQDLVDLILKSIDNIIFIKDVDNLLSINELKREFENLAIEIFEFKSELKLRVKISTENKKIIVIIEDERKIPYDFFNKYPIIDISLKNIFTNLDRDELKKIDIYNIDKIYKEYILKNEIYIKKTKQESEILIDLIREKSKQYNLNKENLEIEEEIENKITQLELNIEKIEKLYNYFELSKLIGEIYYLSSIYNYKINIETLLEKIDDLFQSFILNKYNTLTFDNRFEFSPLNNHILDYISKDKRIALICFDCMSFAEWNILKKYFTENNIKNINEKFSLAMIPSITKYSRLSIFEGKLPIYSEEKNEEKAFKKYFENKEKNVNNVYYKNVKENEEFNFLGYDKIGLVYNFIDEIAHGSLNKKMLLLSTKEYLVNSNIIDTVKYLLENNFKIYITSDHGNVFCRTNGLNISKYLVDEKDIRIAIFPTKNLAEDIKLDTKLILNFSNILGNDKYIVIDSKRRTYGNRKEGISHGGLSIEEMIIPFIEIGGE